MNILFGGDYNPEQWSQEVWDKDMEMFRAASVDTVTLNVFAWGLLQKNEEEYDFSALDETVRRHARAGHHIIMATSTSTVPAWLAKKHPEVLRTDYHGVHKKFGKRHNFCPNSPVYRRYAGELVRRLAERYKNERAITYWHIGNEFEGECYCENCEKAFRVWLKEKYGTIEALNAAWNTAFWSHTFYDFDEIVLPNDLADGEAGLAFMSAVKLDYARFNSDSQLACYKAERDIIKAAIPDAKCTTNLMGTCRTMDYFRWAKEMDIVSWDCYPGYRAPWSETAMTHDLMRGLKDAPFLLMEQAPSQQNWQPYNTLKQPGEIRAQSYQSMAHGSDAVLFFQMRQSVGGCEKFHSALISHSGRSDTRVFRELSALGAELKMLGDKTVGATTRGQAAIVFDWDSYRALEMSIGPSRDLRYVPEIWRFYDALYRRHIPVDFIPADASADTLAAYPLVLCPVLYMVKGDTAANLTAYVRQGGTLVTGYMSGMADENDQIYTGGYPGPLREVCGLWLDERDALPPDESRKLSVDGEDGYTCGLLCDLICPEGAEIKAQYESGFYAGTAAVTVNRYGQGQAWYFGTKPDNAAFDRLMDEVVEESGAKPLVSEPTPLEITCREKDGKRFWFVLNFTTEPQPVPQALIGLPNLLSGKVATENTQLSTFDVLLLLQEDCKSGNSGNLFEGK